MTIIYKIFRDSEFQTLLTDGRTDGAPVDLHDGYIHFSTGEQLRETAAKHFKGEDGLHLLALDADSLGDALRWEPSRGGALFPHLYRALHLDDLIWHKPLPLTDGAHDFTGLL
ncbi:DUF952 domain-containing protein [Aquicoccus sp.]|uniref:DUF952 domain-containing protein n=1 Tax=Aquicoccus sp. TaxID=2055851 RepID=UPI00356A7945